MKLHIVISTLLFFNLILSAKECSKNTETFTLANTKKTQLYSPSRMMFRIGKINLTGKYSLENLETSETKSIDDIEQEGWEFSIVGGVDTRKGFDFKPVVTLQWFKIIKSGDNMASNMSLLGEFEFAYNFNKYFSPFIGFNAGVGITDFNDDVTDAGYGAQFSVFSGINGYFYNNYGYYIKLSAAKKTSYFTYQDINHYMSSNLLAIKYGLSYRF
jgi:hypothetical protein